MSQLTSTGILRFDVHDPADLALLVATGMIWRSGPKVLKLAMDAIRDGDIARPVYNVPPAVDAHLDRLQVPRVNG